VKHCIIYSQQTLEVTLHQYYNFLLNIVTYVKRVLHYTYIVEWEINNIDVMLVCVYRVNFYNYYLLSLT